MQKWEYLFVSCSNNRGEWRPRYINGQEVANWRSGPSVYAYSNEIGPDGWELVNLATGESQSGNTESYRLVFKKPRQ
jgi:hypothetical protein